ncbi:MAG TPA: DUF3822 family protein [Bacteroidales bacterium]|nr:DUF3822 family protein [Bacteroidales bacterium]
MKSFELFDETLDINATENYELAIQAGPDGFAFCLLDTLRNKIVLFRASEPDDNKYYNSESINEFIAKDDFLNCRYKKTRLILPSQKFTLVPAPLFDPAKKDDYFRFNHNQEINSLILSNKNTDPDLFIIYTVSLSLHEVMKSRFPAVYPYTHIIPLFDNISRERRSSHGNYIHLHIERDYFNLIVFHGNDLRLCNAFKYRNISDILYFVMNVFNKLEIKQEETIHLSGFTEKYDDLSSAFTTYIKTLKFAEPRGNFTFSYVFNDIELHRYLNLFSVFNCG